MAFQAKEDVDKAYVRCMRILFDSPCYPMIASHDPRLVEIAGALATRADKAKGTHEHQMLYGVRPDEQRRLSKAGERVRAYIPYGEDWYGYMVRRMAEKPANLGAVRQTDDLQVLTQTSLPNPGMGDPAPPRRLYAALRSAARTIVFAVVSMR